MILLIYVDNILITGSNVAQVNSLISHLSNTFALRGLVALNYFLGVEVTYQHNSLHLNQQKYIQDLLKRIDMFTSKATITPRVLGKQLSLANGDPLPDPTIYRRIVGVLQYVTLTRLDLSFAVNKACQFMAQPTIAHWSAVKRILRYLKGTSSHGFLLHASSSLNIQGYTDADWASYPDDRHSTGGYYLFLGPNLVSWFSTK